MNNKGKIPPFLSKLYEIVSNENNKDIISWNNQGNGFIIKNYSSFIKTILSSYFKTNVFTSFVRQLNLYNFHKVKPQSGEYEFINNHFNKSNKDNLSLIKRKTKQEIELKGNEIELRAALCDPNKEHNKPKKMDLDGIKNKTRQVAEAVSHLQRRIEILEGKHDFLDYCHSELSVRNQKIRNQLKLLSDKEKNLENFFFYIMRTFTPSLKISENILPDENLQKEPRLHMNKNEFVNQIIKQIQACWNRNNNQSPQGETMNNDTCINLKDVIDILSHPNVSSNLDVQNEMKYFSQIKNFQHKYLSDLEEETSNSNPKSFKTFSMQEDTSNEVNNISNRNCLSPLLGRKTERTKDVPNYDNDLLTKSNKDDLNDSLSLNSINKSGIHFGNFNMEGDSDIM